LVVLPDLIRGTGAGKNFAETQLSGHTSRSGPEIKLDKVVTKLARREAQMRDNPEAEPADDVRRRYKKNSFVLLNTAWEFERGENLLQVACQASALALEMTENALLKPQRMRGGEPRNDAPHLIACSPSIFHSHSISSYHQGLGERPRRLKETEALVAFKRSEKMEGSAQCIFCVFF